MSKVRVYEVAKQLNLDPKAVVSLFQAIGVADVRNHMSSVEPEAVDRIKRHLEKQRTHNVVEERIRPTVVKRRAVAKPATDRAAAAVPSPLSPAASVAALESTKSVSRPAPVPSAPVLEQNGHGGASEASATEHGSARARSSRKLHHEEHVSAHAAHDLESVPAMHTAAPTDERASARSGLGTAAESQRTLAEPEVSAPPAPPAGSSSRSVSSGPSSVPSVVEASPAAKAAAESSAHEAVEVQEDSGARAEEDRQAATTVAASIPPLPVDQPAAAIAPPEPAAPSSPAQTTAASPAPSPASVPSRQSNAPKTGVEYWAGRPGVPMPQPGTSPRIGPGPAQPGMPRRVQYDPRAGAGAAMPPRREVRAPGQQQNRGPMNRPGGPGNRRFSGSMQQRKVGGAPSTQEMSAHKKVIRIEENITLQQMAGKMSLKSTELLMKLLSMGMTGVHINTTLDADTAKLLASEFGWEVEDVAVSEEQSIAAARGEEAASKKGLEVGEELEQRAPVVTVMGHVDHGKTSLLDKIRKANVAQGEAGGITQHIGAYKVQTSNGPVVFLDTPGHEAFTQMRARGASVTDIVVLVVAADDGVMPQTKEAVNHAKAGKVPIIVAVNKVDKPQADPDRVKRELVELGLQPEEWGGETIFVNVSALTGEGIDQLLEMIGLQAEVLELKANPKMAANGTVLEALLDRGRGPVARVLVQDGTLRVGDFVLAGPGFGKVRAMTNELGKQVHEAGPSTPVEILGLSDVPNAGDPMHAVKDAKKAQEIAESRKGKMARSLIPATAKVSLEELSKRIADTSQQELRIIIKGDVQGSVEALADALSRLSGEKVRLSIIHAAVGAITEGDINLAIAAKSIIIGFNVRPAGKAAQFAEENKIEIRLYSIIYNAVDDVKAAMEGLLPPTLVEKQHGRAEIRQVFRLKVGTVAGCFVVQGTIKRTAKVRLVRDNAIVWDGKLAGLKRLKDDVREVAEGFECGITLEGYHDVKERDIIECYEIEEIKQKL